VWAHHAADKAPLGAQVSVMPHSAAPGHGLCNAGGTCPHLFALLLSGAPCGWLLHVYIHHCHPHACPFTVLSLNPPTCRLAPSVISCATSTQPPPPYPPLLSPRQTLLPAKGGAQGLPQARLDAGAAGGGCGGVPPLPQRHPQSSARQQGAGDGLPHPGGAAAGGWVGGRVGASGMCGAWCRCLLQQRYGTQGVWQVSVQRTTMTHCELPWRLLTASVCRLPSLPPHTPRLQHERIAKFAAWAAKQRTPSAADVRHNPNFRYQR
jgi:hypothetical protein